MSLVFAQALSVRHGPKILLDEESFALSPTDRVGLVGPNGAGKSTLLRLLAGELEPDSGEVQRVSGTRVAYLPQELSNVPDGPLAEAVMRQVPGRLKLTTEHEEIEAALLTETDEAEQLDLAQRLADLEDLLAHFDARFGRHRAEEILLGLGFGPGELERPTGELSGGWKMRAALAGLLLTDPDLLLLDEPTNHLDVPSLAWFDEFLQKTRHAIVLVSHDRDFLNRQIARVLSFEPEGLRSYPGDYDAYRQQRSREAEQLRSRAERQAKKRAETEAFIERFRAKATKARQVQSRERMLEREERIETLAERKTVQFRFPEVARSGREVLRLEAVGHRFGGHVVFEGLSLKVLRGERIAIVGANGAGKTTLLRIAAGELVPDAGAVAPGPHVSIGYFAQHHSAQLDPMKTVLDEIAQLVPDKPPSFVRGVLGAFLFSGDDVDKTISVLSGGERARVALARLLVVPSNLLLMDEPTNHLDLDSSEALIRALADYGGTLVFVSHNLSFVNQLATRTWEVKDRRVHEWPGNLDDYWSHLRLQGPAALPPGGSQTPSRAAAGEKERKRLEAEARQARSARERPLREEVARLERRIAELERVAKESEAALATPELFADFERAKPHLSAYRSARAELEALYERWAEVQARLEEG